MRINKKRICRVRDRRMGDCCIPIIIVCGSRSFIRRKEPKDALVPLVKQVYYCHNCRCHRHAGVFKRNDWFTLCFIPVFPCHLGKPYLGCDSCRSPLSVEDVGRECRSCGNLNNQRNLFCQACGQDQRPRH